MRFQSSLPDDLKNTLAALLGSWRSSSKLDKLWEKDATLWTGGEESKWLGWLDIVERQQKDLATFLSLGKEVRAAGFTHCLLLGMGGSSLCPEVLSLTFGHQDNSPSLHIVDSTDPQQVAAARAAVDLSKTIVIVSSKSGSTLEPNILKDYFFTEMQKAVGQEKAGSHFIAVTDPGSKMERVSQEDRFRHIFYGDPAIGGRFSALSNFGIVPAAVIGLDVARFSSAKIAVDAARNPDLAHNYAVQLGIILGLAHNRGRDKLTLFASPEIFDLGAWLEELIAESTGKQGKGITPVDREHIAAPDKYGPDRLFAYIRLKSGNNAAQDAAVAALEAAGHPVVRFEIDDIYDLAAQFFTWEVAVAIAGSIMGIDPFNQPDVEAAKIATRALTDEYAKTGKLAQSKPLVASDGLTLYADEKYAAQLGSVSSAANAIKAHLAQLKPHDYFATLAFIQMTQQHEDAIQQFRHKVRDARRVATCLGFGPRFLHSTGQDYKGGPNTGVFLQITADHAHDLAIPNAAYTFGIVIAAQAAGDLTVLQQRNRRALRVHLGADIPAGLATLNRLIDEALK